MSKSGKSGKSSKPGNLNKIPKIIHQIWYQGESNIPQEYVYYSKTWKSKNKDYEWLLWSEHDILQLIEVKFPEYLEFFNSLPEMIQKIDFAKYCIIYTYGGVYVDMDSECLKSIDGLFGEKKIYFVDLDTDIFEKIITNYYGNLYNNGWFASVKHHKVWKLIIKRITQENFEKQWYETTVGFIFRTTGPKIMSEVINNLPAKQSFCFLDHETIDPIKWIDYSNIYDIDYSNYPNSYSIHHYGSKCIGGESWQNSVEIVGGIVYSKVRKHWYLFLIAIGLLIYDYNKPLHF